MLEATVAELWRALAPARGCLARVLWWPQTSEYVGPLARAAWSLVWLWLSLMHSIALFFVGHLAPLTLSTRPLRGPGERGRGLFPRGAAVAGGPGVVAAPKELEASAMEQARRLRRGDTSSLALVRASIQRIQQVNTTLNAVVAERFEVCVCVYSR